MKLACSGTYIRSNLVYQFTCPGGSKAYISQTDRNLATRLSEHSDPLKVQKTRTEQWSQGIERTDCLSVIHLFVNIAPHISLFLHS